MKMIKTGLKLLLWSLFTHTYILVNKKAAAVHHFCRLNLLPSSVVHAL